MIEQEHIVEKLITVLRDKDKSLNVKNEKLLSLAMFCIDYVRKYAADDEQSWKWLTSARNEVTLANLRLHRGNNEDNMA